MKKEPYYLQYYFDWMESGRLPSNGLCSQFKNDPFFELIDPDRGQRVSYWGIDGSQNGDEFCAYKADFVWYAFTPFRQTVVLLMAAMNNEL